MATTNFFDRKINGPVTSQSVPNELFTVSAQNAPVPGSPFENKPYTYDASFGVQFDVQLTQNFGSVGIGPQHTFQKIQTPSCITDYRVSGDVCSFSIESTFDRGVDLTSEVYLLPLVTSPAPLGGVVTGQEEIRIRPLRPLTPQPNISYTSTRFLPPSISTHLTPRFTQVEILNGYNQNIYPIAPNNNNFSLGARLLEDGVIALTVTQPLTQYPTPGVSEGMYTRGLLVSDLVPLDHQNGDVIKIIVNGSYII